MGASVVPLTLAIVVAGVVALVVLGRLSRRKRRQVEDAVAAAHGWTVTPRDDSWGHRFPGEPFGQGFECQAHHIVQGQHGNRPFVAFDYVFHTIEQASDTGRRNVVSHWHAILALETSVLTEGGVPAAGATTSESGEPLTWRLTDGLLLTVEEGTRKLGTLEARLTAIEQLVEDSPDAASRSEDGPPKSTEDQ